MSYPNLINANEAPTTVTNSLVPSDYTEEQSFTIVPESGWYEVNAAGDLTTNPLGQSGPFLLEIDSEEILCSSITDEGNAVVWFDKTNGANGRGYNDTTIAAHNAAAPVSLVATSAQDFGFNAQVATLTNKRITKRVLEYSANAAAPAIDSDNYDVVHITGQTTAITGFTMTGSPNDGDELHFSITGSATAIAWGTSFEASTVALPTVTVLTHRLDVHFRWNTETTKWRCLNVA